ncbi:MAG: hypothetical protein QM775_25305 [Pirellulales bacterium]
MYCLLTVIGITAAAFFLGESLSNFIFFQSLFFAFARFYPEEWIYIYFILPVKVKWLAWISGAVLVILFTLMGIAFKAAVILGLASYFAFFGRELFLAAQQRQEVGRSAPALSKCHAAKRRRSHAPVPGLWVYGTPGARAGISRGPGWAGVLPRASAKGSPAPPAA